MPQSTASRPLAGLRVLDLTRVLAGPYCTLILADLGADVVKIERPAGGDDARLFGPFLPSGESAYFASINRGKRSITLDLKHPADVRTFLRLVERADVLVENFRPGTMESLGLASQRLREINPRLIYASASGFGRTGGYGRRPAYDVIIQAMSGLMSVTGNGDGQPVRAGTSVSDILTGLFTAIGILASLRGRGDSGRGADLDLAMLDCTVAALENAICRCTVTGEVPVPLGSRHPSITPFQAFPTADVPIVIAAGNETLWRKLCEVLATPELQDDPRFATNAARSSNCPQLEPLLTARLTQRPAADWLAELEAAGIPSAPIRNIADVVADPELAARGMLHQMEDAGSSFLTAGSPFHINGSPPSLSPHAPKLGEHTQMVLREWLEDV